MEEIKFSDDAIEYYEKLTKEKKLFIDKMILNDSSIETFKDFVHEKFTKEQKLFFGKLMLSDDRYLNYGLCKECKQPNTGYKWCQLCNAKRFQQNFKNWTSGNHDIDKFIQNLQLKAKNIYEVLEWIEYDRFKNVEYLAKGGFGITYKAIWKDGYICYWNSENNQWRRNGEDLPVALKCLYNSQDITVEFLREIDSHILMNTSAQVTHCYGITKEPETNNFMMIMAYAHNGSLRQHLDNNFNSLNWHEKLDILQGIALGLNSIHDNRLIHHDFHCGLCQPANVKSSQSDNKEIYGILSYIAPEVLRSYGFGIIAYEVCTGLPPYHDMIHEEFLAIKICQGLRPKSDHKIPQLILDIIKQCWDANPLKRPKAKELKTLIWNLNFNADIENSLIHKQIKEADEINKRLSTVSSSTGILSYTTHPQSVYSSRLLDFKNLPEPKNSNDIDNLLEEESMLIDLTKLNMNSKDESN